MYSTIENVEVASGLGWPATFRTPPTHASDSVGCFLMVNTFGVTPHRSWLVAAAVPPLLVV